MDIENMNIEKATERCKALTNPEQGCWIGISNQKAIETVLSELEKKEAIINEMVKQLAKLREKRRGRLFYKSTYKCMRNKI